MDKIIFPDKEIKRIQVINRIQQHFKLYNKYNILLSDLVLNETNKKHDPILSEITENTKIPPDILIEINKLINRAIKLLSTVKQSNNKVIKKQHKSKDNYILLIYRDIHIEVNKKAYNRIKSQIINDSFKKYMTFDTLLWILYYRYINLQLYNNSQGAVHPSHYHNLHKKHNLQVEGFGSFFNHTLKYYYGLFPDIEKYFGCLGNFFLSKLTESFYVINPPFTVYHINRTIKHIIKQLNIHKSLTILLVIPSWINKDRQELNKICSNKLTITKYDEDVNMNELWKSKYIKQYLLYCKNTFKYFDYIKEQSTIFAPTNLILCSSDKKYSDSKYNLDSIFGSADIKYKN